MKTVHAVYQDGVFRPSDPVDLPENSQVQITIQSKPSPGQAQRTLSYLARIAGEFPDNPDLPADLAAQHDHYLYGTPKRS